MWGDDSETKRSALDQYIPIYILSLTVDTVLDFDLYVYSGHGMVLFRSSELPLTVESRNEMMQANLKRLYISKNDRRRYQKHVQNHISQILADQSVDEFTRASIV
jgi:hypothetical protein